MSETNSNATVSPPPPVPGTRKVALSASHQAGQALILNAISVPVMAYIISHLGAAGFGQWATATALVSTITVLTNLGLRGSFVRAVARRPEKSRDDLSDQLSVRLLLCLITAPMAIAACVLLRHPPIIVACTAIAAMGIFPTVIAATFTDLLQGLHRMSIYATTNFVAGLVLTIASIVAVAMGGGPRLLCIAYLMGPVVSVTTLAFYVWRTVGPFRPRWHLRRFGVLLKESRYLAVPQLIGSLSSNAESLILPRLVASAQFGYFSAGLLVPQRLGAIPESLASALYPAMVQAHVKDPERSSETVMRYLLMTLSICLPVAVAIAFLAGPIAAVLFSKNLEVCRNVIRATIWWLPLAGVEQVIGYGLISAGLDKVQARISIQSAAISLVMSSILISQFGIVGACVSYLCRIVVKLSLAAPPFARAFSLSVPVGGLARLLACCCAMAAAMGLVRFLMPSEAYAIGRVNGHIVWLRLLASVFVEGIAGMAVYVTALVSLRILRIQDLVQLLRRQVPT